MCGLIRLQLVTCDNRSASIATRSAQRPGRPRFESARGRFSERYNLTKLKTYNSLTVSRRADWPASRPPTAAIASMHRTVPIMAIYVPIVSIVTVIIYRKPAEVRPNNKKLFESIHVSKREYVIFFAHSVISI